MNGTFSPHGYCELVSAFCVQGYRVVGFDAIDPTARHLVLRHDVDMSLDHAVALARLEAERGWTAIYFVLLGSELYTPFSRSGRSALAEIAGLGHEVGLHFDATLYPEERDALDRAAAAEATILENMLGQRVRMVSFHRPAPAFFGDPAPIGGRAHAYQPRFVADIGYCSDSRGEWRHSHPLKHKAVLAGRALQLLTHPIWWIEEGAAPPDRLARFLDARCDALDAALAQNCEAHISRRNVRGHT